MTLWSIVASASMNAGGVRPVLRLRRPARAAPRRAHRGSPRRRRARRGRAPPPRQPAPSHRRPGRGAGPRAGAAAAGRRCPRGRAGRAHRIRRRAAGRRSDPGRRSASQRSSRRSSAAAPNSALRCTLPCSRATTSASARQALSTRSRSLRRAHQRHAALLVADVARQDVGRRRALAEVVAEAGVAHRQTGARGAPPCRAPSSGARRCRPRGGSRRAAARRTGGPPRAARARARRSWRSTSNMREGRASIRPRETSRQTRSGTSASTSPLVDHRAHQRLGFGSDAEVVEAGRESGDAQDAHRVFGEGRRDVAQQLRVRGRARRPRDRSSVPSASSAIALMVRSRRCRSSSSVTSGEAWNEEAVIAGRRLSLGARQRVFLFRLGMEEDREIGADGDVAERAQRVGRGADDDPVAVLNRQAEQAVAHGAADDVRVHGQAYRSGPGRCAGRSAACGRARPRPGSRARPAPPAPIRGRRAARACARRSPAPCRPPAGRSADARADRREVRIGDAEGAEQERAAAGRERFIPHRVDALQVARRAGASRAACVARPRAATPRCSCRRRCAGRRNRSASPRRGCARALAASTVGRPELLGGEAFGQVFGDGQAVPHREAVVDQQRHAARGREREQRLLERRTRRPSSGAAAFPRRRCPACFISSQGRSDHDE